MKMKTPIISVQTLKRYLNQNSVEKIRHLFDRYPMIDLAHLVEQIKDPQSLVYLFRTCKADHTAELFSYLSSDQQSHLIHSFTDKQILSLLSSSYRDDIADFLEDMPANLVSRILKVAPAELRNDINLLLNYQPGTAGSMMTTEYITIPEHFTIKETLIRIRQIGKNKETIYSNFIVDDKRFLKGIIYIEDVVFHDDEMKVSAVMNQDFISCDVHTNQEEVAQLFKRYDLSVIPVLNESKHLVGIITIDDIVDVIENAASEDILKMAAIKPLDDSYRSTSPLEITKKSLPWILGLMIIGGISTITINQFESIFQHVIVLTAFIPMIMNTGGNAGNQSIAIINRAIAVGELTSHDIKVVVKKELQTASLMAIITATFAFVWINFLLISQIIRFNAMTAAYTFPWFLEIFRVAGLVSLTLLIAVIVAKLLGSLLPLFALKIKKDPAMMSSPFLTTIMDFSSLMIYFLLANFLFNFF